MQPTLGEMIASFSGLITNCVGDQTTTITDVSAATQGRAGSLVYANKETYLKAAFRHQVAAVITFEKLYLKFEHEKPAQTSVLISAYPEWAFTSIARAFFSQLAFGKKKADIHPTAVIPKSVKLGNRIEIGPFAVIGEEVIIDDDCRIGANTYVGNHSVIGARSVIYPLAYIGRQSQLGQECIVQSHTSLGSEGFGYAHDNKGAHHLIPHLGRVVLEDQVEIGSSCTIDRGTMDETRIGRGTKLDNHCHVAHNCIIGQDCLITAGFVSAGSVTIGDRLITGGRVTVSGHLSIVSDVQLAAFSVVSKPITQPGQYGGYPLQPLKLFLKNRASMAHLIDMRAQLAQLQFKIQNLENLKNLET